MLSFGARIGAYYAVAFGFMGAHLPFFPTWLESLGYTEAMIALLLGLPIILRVPFSLVVSVVADSVGDRRRPIIVLSGVGAFAALVFVFWPSLWPVAVASCVIAMTFGAVVPLTDALAMSGDRETRSRYGQIRLWGSVAFIAANIACGILLARYGPEVVPWWLLGFLIISTLWALLLPSGKIGSSDESVQNPKARWFDGLPLLRSRIFLLFVLGIGATQAAHGVLYTFASIHWKSIGYDGTWIGVFWALGVAGEVAFFAYSKRIFALLSPAALLLLACGVTVVRMSAMAFDPPLPLLIMLQLSHALSFGAMHLGMIHFINEAVPDRLTATAQGLFAAISLGIINGLSFLASGPLYREFGAHAYLFSAMVGAIGGACALIVLAKWRRQALV